MTSADARERVQRGAALLDEKRPGWADKINIATLRMSSECACILGQLEGMFWSAAQRLFGGEGMDLPTVEAVECGLWTPLTVNGVDCQSYNQLQDAWVEEIEARRLPPVTWTHRAPQAVGEAHVLRVGEEQSEPRKP